VFVSAMPAALSSARAVADQDGSSIYVIGGSSTPGTSSNAVYKYDVASGNWTTDTPMLMPRVYFGATLGYGGFIYAVGGTEWNAGSPTDGTVERRDPVTGQWSMVAPLAVHPHHVGTAVADANGVVYALGGWNGTFGPLTGAVECYEPSAASWQVCTSLPAVRNTSAAILAPSGRIHVFGGHEGPNVPSSVVYCALPTVTVLGPGCPGSRGVPLLHSSLPRIGTTIQLSCQNLVPGEFAWIAWGFSDTHWNGVALPLDMSMFGMTGCTLRCAPETGRGGPNFGGLMVAGFLIPGNAAWIGTRLHSQGIGFDPGRNAFGAVLSNALTLTVE
jgi:N-acetylneuraminic acid mutarotase